MTSIFIRESRKYSSLTRLFALLLFIFPTLTLLSQEKTVTYYADPSGIPPDLPVKITHLEARVGFVPEQHKVNGSATFTFTPNRLPVDSILFSTPGFDIREVTIGGRPARWHVTGNNLVILPGDAIGSEKGTKGTPESKVTIDYSATPESGPIYFIGWQPQEAGKRKQIWAHRPNGWLPYMDGRITVDMYITFDSAYNVYSNGERIKVTDNPGGTHTWHYAMKKDHPFFSTALAIGDYRYKQAKTTRGVPLEFWYYADMPDRVGTTYMYTERMFDFFEKELGINYPYPVYREAPVIDYMYGAMETTTSTIFGDYMQITPRSWWQRNYVNVNAHELAHQWFGNCVSHFVNRDVWLTESFGTYYAKLFEKSIYGEDYYQNIRNDEMRMAFEAAARNSFPVGGSQGGTQRIYQKGSLVLDMLRDVMGEEGYRKAVRMYLEKYAFGSPETGDFIRCTYEATGKPWNWFFDEWILRGGEPEYRVTDSVSADATGKKTTWFKVDQVQKISDLSGLFRMPVGIEVHYTDGTFDRTTAWVEKQHTEVAVANPGNREIAFLLFDPGRKILKKAEFNQPAARRLAQAVKAPSMIDRYDGWLSLRSEPAGAKAEALRAAFGRETFWLIRSEILTQLVADSAPETTEIFRRALHDRDALVRKTALQLLNPVPELLRSSVEALLYDSSYVNVELALEDLCVSFPKDVDSYLDQTRDMEGWRGKNIRMMWLAVALKNGKKEYLPELIAYCGPRYEFETRMNAFILLGKLGYTDDTTKRYAEEASRHWNNKLSTAAKSYLAR